MEELDCDFSARAPSFMKTRENYHAAGGLSTSVARPGTRSGQIVAQCGSNIAESLAIGATVRPVGQCDIVQASQAQAALLND